MAKILNIDTSSHFCSVALAQDAEIVLGYESPKQMDHSSSLAPLVEKVLAYLRERNEKLDAVAVTSGPGSYTGLRIGLSLAKGLVFGFDIPLITLSSLEVMAVRAIFSYTEFQGNELVIPMMDARRMEVYTAVFNSDLSLLKKEAPLILDESSLRDLDEDKTKIFIGDGTEKFKDLYKGKNVIWLGNQMGHAKYMTVLSEKKFRAKDFSDVAYSVPNYLKEYMVTTPKNHLF